MARALTAALTHEFTGSTRSRGEEYARANRVRIDCVDDQGISAIVRGTSPYLVNVTLAVERGTTFVVASCECPFASDRAIGCKHIWATLVCGERSGYFHPVDGPVEFVLEPPEPFDDDDAEDAEPNFYETGRADRRPPEAAGRRGNESRRSHPGSQLLSVLESHAREVQAAPPATFRYAASELMYAFVPPTADASVPLYVHVLVRSRKKNGEWSKPKPAKLTRADLLAAPDPDRPILAALFGGVRSSGYFAYDPFGSTAAEAAFGLPDALMPDLLPAIAKTGRAFLQITRDLPAQANRYGFSSYAAPVVEYLPMRWDEGPPWRFAPIVTPTTDGWQLDGRLTRADGEWLALGDLLAISRGFVWTRSTVARADFGAAAPLVLTLATAGAAEILRDDTPRLAAALAELGIADAALPEPLQVTHLDVAPRPRLHVRAAGRGADVLAAELTFAYGESIVPHGGGRTSFDPVHRQLVARRPDEEAAALARLTQAGVRQQWDAYTRQTRLELPARQLAAVVPPLLAEGWHVDAESGAFRSPGSVQLSVVSGVDWFDLHATVEFGGGSSSPSASAPLTDVLAALERRESTVRLGDGTIGILPEAWLQRYLPLAAAGEAADGRLRFRRPQAALLDALLSDAAAHADVQADAGFTRAREELARLGTLAPADPPASFVGVLREYQREGLAWLQFLQRSGFGGCLADDMGLGKTIMVLARLLGRRDDPDRAGRPSVIVVPRSLVHNWMSEASRFAPDLRLTDFSSAARKRDAPDFADVDVVLVTYGTLRQDVLRLKDVDFDYVILDEAQAIKNAATASAKAVRLLRGRHRLALTGTPIENHLGELWSLFEFLNPGVLGRSTIFQRAASATPDADAIPLLARGLRPFLLRRTKQQVARELPAKTEQTITCELSKPERALYDSLRRHYRDSVLARVDRDGLKRSQMHILEALLRLRQAACHPALVDRTRSYSSSAKLDVVLAQAKEVIEEGHKAIVFSQFTTLLALLREQLDRDGIVYEYLDGRTKRRGDKVARFQTDPDCRLFLISLKAGGVGLNLTAAEYVFLLDPWWNPAVEAQAIDRTHRIGQTREVFAYRLVAGDTIESKILDLQAQKRALADAVLGGGTGGLKQLDRADLELLLS